MPHSRLVVSVFALALSLGAQSWSVTAAAPVTGTASASALTFSQPPTIQTNTQTLAVGPVPAGIFLSMSAQAGSASAYSRAQWSPSVVGQVAPLAFRVEVTAWAHVSAWSGGYSEGAGGSVSCQLDLTLHAPQPTAGRLALRRMTTTHATGSVSLSVDADGDGLAETISTDGSTADVAVVIPAAGTSVRVTIGATASESYTPGLGSQPGSSGAIVFEAQFLPDEPTVTPFDDTGAFQRLSIDHKADNTLTIGAQVSPPGVWPFPAATAAILVFGSQPVVIPALPSVTQLVTIDAWFAMTATFPVSSMTLALPSLPPGTEAYCQALLILTDGSLRSSNSLRALWP